MSYRSPEELQRVPQRCDGVRTERGVASKISPAKSRTNEIPLSETKAARLVLLCDTAVKSFQPSSLSMFCFLCLFWLFNSCKYECRYFVTFLLFLIFVFSQQKVKKQTKIFCICRTVRRDCAGSLNSGFIWSKIFMDIYIYMQIFDLYYCTELTCRKLHTVCFIVKNSAHFLSFFFYFFFLLV